MHCNILCYSTNLVEVNFLIGEKFVKQQEMLLGDKEHLATLLLKCSDPAMCCSDVA